MNVTRDTVKEVQRDWPLRSLKKLRRQIQVVLAIFRYCAWRMAWTGVRVLEWFVCRLRSRLYGRMRAAWHVVRPFDTGGEEENFTVQKQYDAVSSWFDGASIEERNAMVVKQQHTWPFPERVLRGLVSWDSPEIPHAN